MKQSLYHIVGVISSSSTTRDLSAMIGKHPRFLNRIVDVVKQNSETSEAGIKAISALCCLESNREQLVQQGLIEKARENGEGAVKMVFRVSDEHEGSESAINLLMKVCEESLEAREKAIVGGVLTQLLLLLQSQCSGRTKTKATKIGELESLNTSVKIG